MTRPLVFRPVRRSAIREAHLALGATFRDHGAWEVVETYTAPRDEAAAALRGVGLADTSAGGRFGIRGDAIEEVLRKVAGVEAPAPGRAAWAQLAVAEVLLCRLAPDEVLILTSVADATPLAELLARAVDDVGCAHVTDWSAGLTTLDLLGPNVRPLLAKVAPLDLSDAAVPPLGVVQGECARVRAALIRLDWPQFPAFRVLVGREVGLFVWERLVDAGPDLGLVPVGRAARALLDAEA